MTNGDDTLRKQALAYLYDGEFENALAEIDRAVAAGPETTENYETRILIRTAMDEMPEVADDLETLRRLAPDSVALHVWEAYYRIARVDLPGATKTADRAVQLDPNDADALFYQAVCRVWNNTRDEARVGFEKVRTIFEARETPLDYSDLSTYVSTLVALGENDLARSAADEGIRRFPKLHHFYLWRSTIDLDAGNWDAARRDLGRAGEIMRDRPLWDSSLFLGRARLFREDKEDKLADEQLDNVLERMPNHVTALEVKIDMAQTAFSAGELRSKDLQPYLEMADRLCSLIPTFYQYHLHRHWLHRYLDHRKAAQASLDACLDLLPEETEHQMSVALWAAETGWTDVTMDLFERILRREPDNVEALRERGRTWLWMGKDDMALADLNRAVKLSEPDVDADLLEGRAVALTGLGNLEFFHTSHRKAIVDLDRGIEIQPENAVLWQRRGAVWHQIGTKSWFVKRDSFQKALDDYDESLRLNPEDPVTWYCRALTHGQLRDFDAAIADCTEAIRLDPKFEEALRFRAELLRDR